MKGKWQKQNSKKKGNAVLQKYKMSVDEFIKNKGGSEEVEADKGVRFVKKKSRKELRKEMRKMKKAKMKSHYEGKRFSSLPSEDEKNTAAPADKKQKKRKGKAKKDESVAPSSKSGGAPANKSDSAKSPSAKAGKKKNNRLQESRKMALLEANEDEDREIKKLERCLGLNKRKNKKSLPQSFVADGLDYILGVLDAGSSAVDAYDDDDDMDIAKENFEKLDESDSQLSDVEEEPDDDMASEESDEEENDLDEDDEVEESDEDDEMIEDEEEMEDEGNAVGSEDENEEEANTPNVAPDTKTENVSGEIFCKCVPFIFFFFCEVSS